MNRRQARARAMRMPGVRRTRRPETGTTPAFDLSYVRSGPSSPCPAVVLPGGPGLGSVLPYSGIRRRAAASGSDVLMVEHRGVGLSRTDLSDKDLPPTALTVAAAADDIAAVLDAEGVDSAFIYGSSYGSYVAQAFGVRHPERVAGMVLDSVMAGSTDHHVVRSHARGLLWAGDCAGTAEVARSLRELVGTGEVGVSEAGEVARIVYEFAGAQTLHKLLRARMNGRGGRTWRWLAGLGKRETTEVIACVMEFDLVGRIAIRELNYGAAPDGGPFDPAASFADLAAQFGPFTREPFDLSRHRPGFDWPVAVLSGDRDLRTPRPVAERVTRELPDGALVPLARTGHSALDTHARAALAAIEAVREGTHHGLAADPSGLNALRRTGASRHIATIVRAGMAVERLLPAAPRPAAGR